MSNAIRIVLVVMIGFAFTMGTGCGATQKVWISTPTIESAGNHHFEAQLEPLTKGFKFFVSFCLTVTNKTDKNLEIDWNKTRYVHNGRTRGVFVFKGIEPEDIRNLTIPPDIIPSRGSFSKEISPFELLARSPLRDRDSKKGIYPGLLPTGENGILLVVRLNGKEIVEKMTLNIKEREVQ